MSYELSRRAARDVDELYAQRFESAGRASAEELLADLRSAFRLLSTFPHMGSLVDESRPSVRFHTNNRFVILYDVAEPLVVTRIHFPGENWRKR